MQAQIDLLKDSSKKAMDMYKELGEITFKLGTSLAQQQLDMLNIYMESSTTQLQSLSKAKDVKSLLAAQPALVEELGKKLMGNASATVEILADAKSQMTAWGEKSFELARSTGEELRKAA